MVQTWTRDSGYPNRWIGTDIYRILKNTNKFASTHSIGERVVYLDDAVKFISLDETEIGVTRDWKFVTTGQEIDHAATVAVTFGGENLYNRAADAPEIGQMLDASNIEIRIGVKNYSADSKYRKIEISAASDMTDAAEQLFEASEFNNTLLTESFILSNDGKYAGDTFYVRVSHSSNGRDYGLLSNILEVRFADGPGSPGTTGSFDPSPEAVVEVS